MAKPKRSLYVETHAGWRAFFLTLLFAASLGCGFRLYFSHARLKAWVTHALDKQKATMAHPFALSFSDASLRLSDSSGYLPQLAVVVSGVKVAPNPECHPEASVFIGELRLPFRVSALLRGRAAVGIVSARDVTVDLDGLRAKCDGAKSAGDKSVAASETVQSAVAVKRPATSNAPPRPWWSDEQYESVRAFIQGFEFSRAVLQFENKTKEIDLDSFSARLKGDGVVSLRTEMRIPPHVTFDEQIPPLKIEGEATHRLANLLVTARLSEGALQTTGVLTPAAGETLHFAAKVDVKNLPLSMFSPLMRKAGLADSNFQPKFMWLDCAASIEGPFQGLFQKSPLELSGCRIEGDGTDIRLQDSATREPNGDWKPFDVNVISLDLAKLFDTVGARGPEGVASDFGKLNGDVHVESNNDAHFKGQLRKAKIYFSNRNVRASQVVDSANVAIDLVKSGVKAAFDHIDLTDGSLSGHASVEIDRALKTGSAVLDIESLKFAPDVQRVLVGGELGALKGSLRAKIEDGHITDFESKLDVGATQALDFSFDKLSAHAERKHEDPPRVLIDAPWVSLKRGSQLEKSLQPVFFGHEFGEGDLKIDQPHVELLILGDGEIDWSKTHAALSRGQIQLTSSGSMNRDHLVDGWLQVDFPKIKKLRWSLKGSLEAPILNGASDELTQLKARAEINDQVLGL